MFTILLGVAVAIMFAAYDVGNLLTTKESNIQYALTSSAPGDLPENKAKVALRLLTARIILYVLIAAVGVVVIFLVERFIPKKKF